MTAPEFSYPDGVDLLLYEDAGEMVEYLAQALRQTSWEATILLYAPALDPHLQKPNRAG